MFQNSVKYTLLVFLFAISCNAQENSSIGISIDDQKVEVDPKQNLASRDSEFCQVILAAEQTEKYIPLLQGQKVGVVTNQTGIIPTEEGDVHLVDHLISQGIEVVKIFSPEHGFRGTADAGEIVKDGKDIKTGLPIVSLYGSNKKPKDEQVKDLDVILFDIQDVGVRFYTYISTLHYVMESAAENNKKVIVLDRPNPNAHYIDGPMLEPSQKTFVGMHPVPIVYGMTIGEYAQMINGEKWLDKGVQADLSVIPLQNYTHETHYDLPVKPSPNLPNAQSINLYPSICFFEGANVSEGRGTEKQFQVYGSPYLKNMPFKFTPKPNEGAKNPQFNGEVCYGEDLSQVEPLSEVSLKWLIKAYKNNTKQPFFTKNSGAFWIDKLAGTADLRHQIEKGWTEEQIKATWQDGLEKFKKTRAKYLIYK
ncbi:DUF1343 domain-containing protein [Weeksellaceae bacterium KMM 9724]|uniref:exo-beta-N-acetylmuramidase NamZ family protein n=1 Tax=Profundicola chukchiensis TaxID=2961959 RepID=UPI002437CB08|nr:DUF1343 domain-containing protein [Profundicola chukchiensis]MDG4950255.1 DUF1343 domain-containing protein [Profundicola chukchiensis]